MTTDSKKDAINELKKQIEREKKRLGPEKLQELQSMAKDILKGDEKSTAPATVPYDKKSAMKALRLYIENHANPEQLEKQILEMLKKILN